MSMLDQALADLGRDMGFEALAFGPSDGLQLRFDHGAALGFTRLGDDLVLHWSEPIAYEAAGMLFTAFKRLGNPQPGDPAVQVGLHGADGVDHLVLATRIHEQSCNARELQRLIHWMRQYVDSLRQ